MYVYTELDVFLNQIFVKIEASDEEITFHRADGRKFMFYHEQDCCEAVYVEEIIGDLDDLIGVPIRRAEERTQEDLDASESGTWTFYEFATIKGSVTIRWYGASNGYYSESVSLSEVR
jgi:hypothetical protein